jgi:hypothetical protein
VVLGVAAGLTIGFALSAVVAYAQGSHHLEIILPGMLVGALAGFVTQWYPPAGEAARPPRGLVGLFLAGALAPWGGTASARSQAPPYPLAMVASLDGRWSGPSGGFRAGCGFATKGLRSTSGTSMPHPTSMS